MQHIEINASFQVSIYITEYIFEDKFYDNPRGLVSRRELFFIMKEIARARPCRCEIRRTHWLPCRCELGKYSIVPLLAIHHYWRRLISIVEIDEAGPCDVGISIDKDVELLLKMVEEVTPARKHAIKFMLKEIVHLDETSMIPPPDKIKTMGQEKKKSKEAKGSTKRIPSK